MAHSVHSKFTLCASRGYRRHFPVPRVVLGLLRQAVSWSTTPPAHPRGGTPGRVAVRALWGRPRLLPSAGQHHQLTLLVWSFGTTSTAHPRLVPSSSRLVVWSWDSGTCVKPQQQGDNWPYAGRETGLSSSPHLARGYLPCTAI